MDGNNDIITKLCRPRVVNCLNRNRLFKILDNDLPLTLVQGPAGSGKTTLVSTYIEYRQLPCVWYQLDGGDNDPATFFYYLGCAVLGQDHKAKSKLPPFTPELMVSAEDFSRRFFERIGVLIDSRSVLVFDNYQSIPSDSMLHHLIDVGLTYLPVEFKAFILSRNPLPQTFARRKASFQIQSILWEDLKLDFEETSLILDLRSRSLISNQTKKEIHRKCEGWAAGISLIWQAIMVNPISSELLNTPPEEIFNYFAEEVFNFTDEETKRFLIKTSIFSDMTAQQAGTLTGNQNAKELLFDLLRLNYFVSQPDNTGHTFRYHSLFREFLQAKAKIYLTEKELAQARNKAAKLLEQSGNIEEAISLYLASNHYESAINAIEKYASSLIAQGRNNFLISLLAQLPDRLLKGNHWLLYWQGIATIAIDPSLSLHYFEDAFSLSIEKQDSFCKLSSFAGILDSIFYEGKNFKKFDRWFEKLDAIWSEIKACTDTNIQSKAVDSVVTALNLRMPQYPNIDLWIEHFLTQKAYHKNHRVVSYTLCQIAWFLSVHRANYAKSLVLIDSSKILEKNQPFSPVQILHRSVTEAAIYNITANSEKCIQVIDQAMELSDESGVHLFDFMLIGHKISNFLNLGDVQSARKFLRKIETWPIPLRPWDRSYFHFLKAREALISNRLNEALIHAELQKDLEDKIGSTIGLMLVRTILAQIFYTKGKPHQAKRYFEELVCLSEKYKSENFKFYALFLKAQFALTESRFAVAEELLRKAAQRAMELGYINTFVDTPQALADLCEFALEKAIGVDYFRFLVRSRNLVPATPPIHLENWPWKLKIFTLGRFEIEKENQSIEFNGKSQVMPLRLLKLIIALGGENIPEEKLSDILWPDNDGHSAHRAFSTTIYRLRQLLGIPKLLKITDRKITINKCMCFVDAWAFTHMSYKLLNSQNNFSPTLNTPEGVHQFEKALSLYQGSFLYSENWGEPIIYEREKQRDIYIKLINEIGNYFESNDQFQDAIWYYKRGLAVDEFAEFFYQRLMKCYAKIGQPSEAMNIYERCRRIFLMGYGMEPSDTIKEIRSKIKHHSVPL